jgi:hypothetical protein
MIVANAGDRNRLLALKDERGVDSLPIVADWQEWWREWGPRIADEEGRQPWILFILDAHERQLETMMVVSRLIRNKPEWNTRGWSEAEWGNVEEFTEAAYQWYVRNMPKLESVPEYAQFILSAQHGSFATIRRLGRELRHVQEEGFHTVILDRDEISGMRVEVA